MTCELSLFSTPVTSVNQVVNLADGSTTIIRSKGDVHLSPDIILPSVLHVPNFAFNLLSVSKLAKSLNYAVIFFPHYCVLQDLCSKRIFGRGYEHDGLYYFRDPPLTPPPLASSLQAFVLPVSRSYDFSFQTLNNGVAERKNRQLMSVVRCLLSGMNVPKLYWYIEVLRATFLINRTPSKVLNGYSSMSKGYRCYDPVHKHMYHSLDVTFYERTPFYGSNTILLETSTLDQKVSPLARPLPIFQEESSLAVSSSPLQVYSRCPRALPPLPSSSSDIGSGTSLLFHLHFPDPVPESRYPTRDRKPPARFGFACNTVSFRAFLGKLDSISIPRNVSEAFRNPNWMFAMMVEMDALQQNETWELVSLPPSEKILDVKNAFLNGDLFETIYMDHPPGFRAEGGGLRYFLGIKVAKSKHGISLSQKKYVLDLLRDMGMLGCKPASTPMDPNMKISAESGDLLSDPSQYQRLVGRLIYLTNTGLDLGFTVSVMSQFMHAPRTAHMDAVYHILQYLKSCPGLGLFYSSSRQVGLSCFSDADYAGSKTDRRSTSDFCTSYGDHLIS
ncbi:uncharacterized protein LOC132272588 [Cornus florida]|uniref:uncharacterized protein LOC132272588 n=1 Tax=Cornus florida TaxID=4283 RepID=UPI00289CA1D4|nr:uncharacterized protein LOC132272588 [Cornus florida]